MLQDLYANHKYGQGKTYDELGIPWHYDPDLGPMIAKRNAGEGEGAYCYQMSSDGTLAVVHNPSPATEARFDARRKESARRVMEMVLASEQTQRTIEVAQDSDDESVSDDLNSDDLNNDAQYGMELPNAPPFPTAEHAHASNSNQKNIDETLVRLGCTFGGKPRASTGRVDLRITTPDGKVFRSKVAALAHLQV